MTQKSDEQEAFDQLFPHVLGGIIAGSPATGKAPNWFSDFAATMTLAAIKSRAAAMEQLPKANVVPVSTEAVQVHVQGGYTGPLTPALSTSPAFAPQVPPGVGAAPPVASAAGATPADRTARLMGAPPDTCPVCKGPKTEASRTGDPQCPIFHFQPHGNLTPIPQAATPGAPNAPSPPAAFTPIVTSPTSPINTG